MGRHDSSLGVSSKFDGLARGDACRVHSLFNGVELVRVHAGDALQVGGHILGPRFSNPEGLGASDVDGPRPRRRPVLPHRDVFLDGDFSVVGVSPVHVGDVLDGIRAGGDAFVVGVGGGLGHGRERGSGARVEGV